MVKPSSEVYCLFFPTVKILVILTQRYINSQTGHRLWPFSLNVNNTTSIIDHGIIPALMTYIDLKLNKKPERLSYCNKNYVVHTKNKNII